MKPKTLLSSIFLCFLVSGCSLFFLPNDDNHESIYNNQNSSSNIDSHNQSSNDFDFHTKRTTNYQRATFVEMVLGQMSEKIASAPGDAKGKLAPRFKTDDEYVIFDWQTEAMEEPEIKSLNEPLSMAFSFVEYFIQKGEPNYPIFDKTFYSKQINKDQETEYVEYFKIRDYPNTDEKMIYIQYWDKYHNLIHIDDDGHFSMISEYPFGQTTMNADGHELGNGEDLLTQIDLQANGYRFSSIIWTSDYARDIPGIIDHFTDNFAEYETEENDFSTAKMLLTSYFDLFKKDDKTYDRSDITNPNPKTLGVNDVDIMNIRNDFSSYLSLYSLQNAFMDYNYSYPSILDFDSMHYEMDGTTLLSSKTYLSLYKIPKTVTSINGLLKDPENVDENANSVATAVYIPSNITSIEKGALNNTKTRHFTHIFVDYLEEECPFADVLKDLQNVTILYKNEFIEINKIPVPRQAHDEGESLSQEGE